MHRRAISWISKAGQVCVVSLLVLMVFSGCAGKQHQISRQETVPDIPEVKVDQPQEKEKPNKKDILIAIDPGHQSWEIDMSAPEPNAPGSSVMKAKATTGTMGTFSGTYEYDLNLDISLRLRELLEQEGFSTLLTREDNQTAISNAERATMANDASADILLRIHANGSENAAANGALAVVPSADNTYVGCLSAESEDLAETILDAYCDATGMKNLGLQYNDTMTGINWSAQPVVILEMGFMTNKHDDLAMAQDAFRQTMAEGIAEGVKAYFEAKETAAAVQDEELSAMLQSLANDTAQAGGVWAIAVQRADEEQCCAVNSKPMQSASLIKIFVAATVEENLDSVAAWESYSGETADLLFHMLSESDNEATNALVTRLGNGDAEAGMALVNQYCTENGYSDTSMGRLMLDFDADSDNYTSVKDCCAFLQSLLAGRITGADAILDALKQQTRTEKIPAGVPEGVETANKTGELDTVENDAAIIWSGDSPYILCVMSEDVMNAGAARNHIVAVSQQVYQSVAHTQE